MRFFLVGIAALLAGLGMAGAALAGPGSPGEVGTSPPEGLNLEDVCPSTVYSGSTAWFQLAPDTSDYTFECRYGLPSDNITRVRISIFWVPPEVAPGRVVSGDCAGGVDRPQGSGGWLSGDQYLSVVSLAGFNDRDNVLKTLLNDLEGKDFALRCDYKDSAGNGGGKAPAGKTKTRTANVPEAGGSTPRWGFPVNKNSKQGTVVAKSPFIDDLISTGMSVHDKVRRESLNRREKLRRIKRKVEANCYGSYLGESEFGPSRLKTVRVLNATLLVACERLVTAVQNQLEALENGRSGQAVKGGNPSCQVFRFRLVAKKKGGKWTTTVVRKGVKPRLRVTCKATDDGYQVNLGARGKRTLRQAVGKRLRIKLRRAKSAAAPAPGAEVTVSFTQK